MVENGGGGVSFRCGVERTAFFHREERGERKSLSSQPGWKKKRKLVQQIGGENRYLFPFSEGGKENRGAGGVFRGKKRKARKNRSRDEKKEKRRNPGERSPRRGGRSVAPGKGGKRSSIRV